MKKKEYAATIFVIILAQMYYTSQQPIENKSDKPRDVSQTMILETFITHSIE